MIRDAGPIVAAVLITVLPALYAGEKLDRWSTPHALIGIDECLQQFPHDFPGWNCVDEQQVSQDAQRLLKFAGAISRRYRRESDGAAADLILLAGRPGPIVRHPAEFCYVVRGNEITGDPEIITVSASGIEHTLKVTRYKSPGIAEPEFLIATSWADGTVFHTTEHPRIVYGSAPMIFSLQARCMSRGDGNVAVMRDFLTAVLEAYPKMPRHR